MKQYKYIQKTLFTIIHNQDLLDNHLQLFIIISIKAELRKQSTKRKKHWAYF